MAFAASLAAQPESEVTVTTAPESRDTIYTATNGSCRVSWVISGFETNRGGVHQRLECSLPLAEQIPLISKVMSRVLQDHAGADMPHTLYWGRLYPDGKPDATLALRLALAAKKSGEWDSARGRVRAGNVNKLVLKLANEALIYAELRDMFRARGLDIQVSDVEKVLVMPARQLPFFERFPVGEVKPTDKLPYDCMTWFSIRPRP